MSIKHRMSTSPTIDSVFRILGASGRLEMWQQKFRSRTDAFKFLNRMIFVSTIFPFTIAVVLFFLVAVFHMEWLKIVGLAAILLSYVGIIFHPFIELFVHRRPIKNFLKFPMGKLLNNSSIRANIDVRLLEKLERKQLYVLEFVALEVRAERRFFERRIGLIIGAIDKVGVVPGIAATIIAFNQLASNVSNFVVAFIIASVALTIFGLFGHALAMRLERMSDVIDLIICRKKIAATTLSENGKMEINCAN